MSTRSVFTLAAALFAAAPAYSQPPAAPSGMEISVHRLEDGNWKPVNPGLIFAQNDRVRFRFRANFDGYLYVTNRSTSGAYQRLFPSEEAGQNNRIAAGKEYMIPSSGPKADTVFRISGPAGQEVIYWLVSPVELGPGEAHYTPLPPPPTGKQAPANLTPRCDDQMFRVRGECVDSSAGPQGVSPDEALPGSLPGNLREAARRDLLFLRKDNSTVVSSAAPLAAPLLYEFRLAHK